MTTEWSWVTLTASRSSAASGTSAASATRAPAPAATRGVPFDPLARFNIDHDGILVRTPDLPAHRPSLSRRAQWVVVINSAVLLLALLCAGGVARARGRRWAAASPRALWRVSERQVLRAAGVDGYLYLRFHRGVLLVLALLSLLVRAVARVLPVLLPHTNLLLFLCHLCILRFCSSFSQLAVRSLCSSFFQLAVRLTM